MKARLVAIALVPMLAVLVGCQPAPDSFYEDPATLPGLPGGIARTTQVGFNGNMDADATVMLYQSTDAFGNPMLVSGMVRVPDTPWSGPGPRPLVAFAPATQGAGDRCASSKTLASGGNFEITAYEAFLNAGYAIALTDYQGFGTPGDHTYTVATPSANAVLDAARAALSLPATGLDSNTPVLLFGYSQGGHAVSKALEVESAYAPELNIVGAAAGGVPADLQRVGDHLNGAGNTYFAFLGLTSIGLNAVYPELQLDSYLNDRGREELGQLREACVVDALLIGAGSSIAETTTRDPLVTPEWRARVAEQRVGLVAPQVPVYLYHGTGDEVILPEIGAQLRQDWCSRGATVEWREYVGADHITLEFTSINDVVQNFNSRVAGVPATSNC